MRRHYMHANCSWLACNDRHARRHYRIGEQQMKLCVSISAAPGRVGMIVQNTLYEKYEVDATYIACAVEPGHLVGAIAGVRGLGMQGCAISAPHKHAVIDLLDEVSELALDVASVNTVVNESGKLIGHNTDVGGFSHAYLDDLHSIKRASVIGTGATARSVASALLNLGIDVRLFGRHGHSFDLSSRCFPDRVVLVQSTSPPGQQHNQLVINALGSGVVVEKSLFESMLDGAELAIDLQPSGTSPFIAAASPRCKALGGLKMAVFQSLLQFQLYAGFELDLEREAKNMLQLLR